MNIIALVIIILFFIDTCLIVAEIDFKFIWIVRFIYAILGCWFIFGIIPYEMSNKFHLIFLSVAVLLGVFLYKVVDNFHEAVFFSLIFCCFIGVFVYFIYEQRELDNIRNEIYFSIQEQFDENQEYSGLQIYDKGTSSVVISEAAQFNINELKYALTQHKRLEGTSFSIFPLNLFVTSGTAKFIYYLSINEYDEYGQKARGYKCSIEFSNDDIERINFDNISNQDLLKHGEQIPEYDEFYEKKKFEATLESYQACFKLEGES